MSLVSSEIRGLIREWNWARKFVSWVETESVFGLSQGSEGF